ncbi:MAG: triose-phosphate isomerase [Flavobacteriales bacterium]|jgi:triosephosphate isomerase|nr:triose-phosphate isomerase [Flavobacteriales bacterium]
MRTIVAGNWKMHKDRSEALDLIAHLVREADGLPPGVDVVVAPPFPFLAQATDRARGTRLVVAAQNCHEAASGAFTGEVSVGMLKSIGVGAAIVGHSERRQYYNETDAVVARKVTALLEAGLTPIYCCGELRAEREAGRHFEVVQRQVGTALGGLDAAAMARMVVAYEPVWAIGTGLTASPEQAQEMHAHIRGLLRGLVGDVAQAVPLLYGGSCNPGNAAGLFGHADINGGLIGGASLQAGPFLEIARIAGA